MLQNFVYLRILKFPYECADFSSVKSQPMIRNMLTLYRIKHTVMHHRRHTVNRNFLASQFSFDFPSAYAEFNIFE